MPSEMEMTLRKACGLGLGMALIVAFSIQVCAQKDPPPHSAAPLVLTGAIPLPNVKGRIDHFAFDPTHNRLFVSALGNNTEEIIGIGAQTVVHTISGLIRGQTELTPIQPGHTACRWSASNTTSVA